MDGSKLISVFFFLLFLLLGGVGTASAVLGIAKKSLRWSLVILIWALMTLVMFLVHQLINMGGY